MEKVLISFLGKVEKKREYNLTKYVFPDGKSYESKFVADSLCQHYHIDKIILIGTMTSMWEEAYRTFAERRGCFNDDDYLEIAEALEHNKLDSDQIRKIEEAMGDGSKVVLVKYGIQEEEMSYNMNEILKLESYLHNGDKLYLDITHSFRSLPLFLMNCLIYLKDVSSKKVEIRQINYGMYEPGSKESKIVDLIGVMDIHEWISGAYSFKQFGNAYKISKLLKTINLNDASTRLLKFSDSKNLNSLYALEKQAQELRGLQISELPLIAKMSIQPIVEEFLKECLPITTSKSHALFQYRLAKWHNSKKNYCAAYITLLEGIITWLCEDLGLDSMDKDTREFVKSILKRDYQFIEKYTTYMPLSEWKNLRKKHKELAKIFQSVNRYRIQIAHNINSENDKNSIKTIIGILDDSITKLNKWFEAGTSKIMKTDGAVRNKLFINLSIHPSSKWGEEQLDAASKYGEILDIPFPEISPECESSKVDSIVAKHANQIRDLAKTNDIVVHVLGEMTFTFKLVKKLLDEYIPCVASTTERIVRDNEDGTKTSEFKFIKFRNY